MSYTKDQYAQVSDIDLLLLVDMVTNDRCWTQEPARADADEAPVAFGDILTTLLATNRRYTQSERNAKEHQ